MDEPLSSSPSRNQRLLRLAEIALVFLVFAVHAGRPSPDSNEPHYLGKARHFWDPNWASGDFFLNTTDAHLVFYATTGWLSNWLTLEQFAWTGRILTWALLAWSWSRLTWAACSRPWFAPLSAALFVCLVDRFRLAGEWVVGSFEAKGIAYALMFFALEAILNDRWKRTWVLLGAATAFHVLVGGWACVAAAVTWLTVGRTRQALMPMIPAMLLGAAIGLAGLIPALQLTRGASREVIDEANAIHVYERLPHHLYAPAFRSERIYKHAALFVAWIVIVAASTRDRRSATIQVFVGSAVFVGFAGLAVTWMTANNPSLQSALLKYYWFRFSDVMLPVGAILGAGILLGRLTDRKPVAAMALLAALVIGAAVHLDLQAKDNVLLPHPKAFRSSGEDRAEKRRQFDDWAAACRWISENTPADATFITPYESQSFVWFADRGEVVARKQIPQDAVATVEWRRRLVEIYQDPATEKWRDSLNELSPARLRELGAKYDADYLLTQAKPPMELPVLFQNEWFAVYQLSQPTD